jgi:hypothetical protein
VAYFVVGERDAGRVEAHGFTAVETRFTHVNGAPLVPSTSMLVLPYGRRIAIPRHRVSVLAAYGRVYSAIGGAIAAVGAVSVDGVGARAGLGLAALALFGLWGASFKLGKLTATQHAQREVYERVTGMGADPALLVFGRPHLEGHLRRDLAARAQRLSPDGYRDGLADWQQVATRAAELDPSYLALALTLARVERDDATHDAIWLRLWPIVERLPTAITPITSFDGAAEVEPTAISPDSPYAPPPPPAPVAPAAPLPPPPVLASRRGGVLERGFDVTVPAAAYAGLDTCASCLAPAETALDSKPLLASGPPVKVPYCRACQAHAIREASGSGIGQVASLSAGLVAAATALLVGPSLVSCLVVGVVASIVAAAAVAALFPARRALVPATVARDAARAVARRGGSVTIFCKSHDWSVRLAEAYGGARVARRRLDPRFLGAGVLGVVLAPLVAGAAWYVGNPPLKVDNATGAPVAVWVDGRVVATVDPTPQSDVDVLDSVRLHYGSHVIGWSPVGAAKPSETTELRARLGPNSYLLDPDRRHCYWAQSMVYGTAPVDSTIVGAWPVALAHDTSAIEDWFVDGPKTMKLENGEHGVVRYSLRRYKTCEELAECGADARAKYWRCMAAVKPENVRACDPVAMEACGWE